MFGESPCIFVYHARVNIFIFKRRALISEDVFFPTSYKKLKKYLYIYIMIL